MPEILQNLWPTVLRSFYSNYSNALAGKKDNDEISFEMLPIIEEKK